MGSYAREVRLLLLVLTINQPFCFVKRIVISNILFDFEAMIKKEAFKLVLGVDGFSSCGEMLMDIVDETGGMVHKDTTTKVLLELSFFPKGPRKLTMS